MAEHLSMQSEKGFTFTSDWKKRASMLLLALNSQAYAGESGSKLKPFRLSELPQVGVVRTEVILKDSLAHKEDSGGEVGSESSSPEITKPFVDEFNAAVESFSVDRYEEFISVLSGIPRDELEDQYLTAAELKPYTWSDVASLDQLSSEQQQTLSGYGSFHTTTPEGAGLIFLNVDKIREVGDEYEHHYRGVVEHAISTQVVDLLPHDQMLGDSAKDVLLYDGLREYFAVRLASEMAQEELPSYGFQIGASPAAAFVIGAVGEQVVAHAFFTDDPDQIKVVFEKKYGEGTWETAKHMTLGTTPQERFLGLEYLYGLAKISGQDETALTVANGALSSASAEIEFLQRELPEEPNVHVKDGFRRRGELLLNGILVRNTEKTDEIFNGFLFQSAVRRDGSVLENYFVFLGSDASEKITFTRTALDEFRAVWTPKQSDSEYLQQKVGQSIWEQVAEPFEKGIETKK